MELTAIDTASQFRPVDGRLVRVHHHRDQPLTTMSERKRRASHSTECGHTALYPGRESYHPLTVISYTGNLVSPGSKQRPEASIAKPTSRPPSQTDAKRCWSECTTTRTNPRLFLMVLTNQNLDEVGGRAPQRLLYWTYTKSRTLKIWAH